MKRIILLSATVLLLQVTYAQPGELDSSFGINGIVTADFGPNTQLIQTATQKDGKIVVLAYTLDSSYQYNYFLARFNADGPLDSTFDGDGKLTTFGFGSIAIQDNGKIIVATDSTLISYNTNGSIDSSFSEDGFQHNDFGIASIAVQKDGKIVVVGGVLNHVIPDDSSIAFYDFGLARYNSNGSPDSSFSDDGRQTTHLEEWDEIIISNYSLAIQSDGKIVMSANASQDIWYYGGGGWIIRYNVDGSIDKIRGIGIDIESFIVSIALGPEDELAMIFNILLRRERSHDDYIELVRLNAKDWSGTQENLGLGSIQKQGKIIIVENNGKIIVGGGNLARYNPYGGLDSTFSHDGIQDGNVGALAIANNKLYAVGNNKLYRYILETESSTPPTVTLTTPKNNTTYAVGAYIKTSAIASDTNGAISKVEFYDDTTLLDTEIEAPYSFTWENVSAGNHTLTAKATDNSGLVTTSAFVHISVVPNKPPTVSIIKPSDNEHYAAPAYIHFEAAASDADGRINRVEFYNGSTLIRTEYKYPYTYVWKGVPVGTYTITAVATDNWGTQTTSKPITVKVKLPNQTVVSNKPSFGNNKTILNNVSFSLYPNPVNNTLNISLAGFQQNKPITLSIISVTGIVLKKVQMNSSTQSIPLNVSALAKGVYTIRLISGEKVVSKQFVKL